MCNYISSYLCPLNLGGVEAIQKMCKVISINIQISNQCQQFPIRLLTILFVDIKLYSNHDLVEYILFFCSSNSQSVVQLYCMLLVL